MDLINVFKNNKIGDKIIIEGWIRNHRPQKEYGFIDFFDGTCFNSLQVVYDNKLDNFDDITRLLVGSAIKVEGTLVTSSGKQDMELKAEKVLIISKSSEDYPIQPKRHTMEFLRSEAYLRSRTKTFQAVFKIRNLAAFAIHKYFNENNYLYVHTPLITTSDCEGENQMFKLTTFDLANVPMKDKEVNYNNEVESDCIII